MHWSILTRRRRRMEETHLSHLLPNMQETISYRNYWRIALRSFRIKVGQSKVCSCYTSSSRSIISGTLWWPNVPRICSIKILKELLCVNFLLNAIKWKDPGLNAAISMVKGYKGPTRKMKRIKDTAAYLTAWDHVAKNHHTNRKRSAA